MKRLKILVVGSSLTDDDRNLVCSSLKYYAEQIFQPIGDEILDNIVFEDVVAKQDVHEIRERANEYGYVLVLGNDASTKLKNTSASIDVVECHTLRPVEWSGPMRDRIIEQIKEFVKAWIDMETEGKLAQIAQVDEHEVEWITQNTDQFKRHIQLMIQNGRPHAAFFTGGDQESHLVLRDATKRLREPIQEVVSIVADEKVLHAREESLKKFEQIGYPKVFLMDIDEFMSHVMSMCMQMSGQPARIIVEPVNDTKE